MRSAVGGNVDRLDFGSLFSFRIGKCLRSSWIVSCYKLVDKTFTGGKAVTAITEGPKWIQLRITVIDIQFTLFIRVGE